MDPVTCWAELLAAIEAGDGPTALDRHYALDGWDGFTFPTGVTETRIRDAFAQGVEIGAAAATWVELDEVTAESLLTDVDPEVMDRIGFGPTLSGEWADDPTPGSLAASVGVRADSRVLDALCDAWELGASTAFLAAVEWFAANLVDAS